MANHDFTEFLTELKALLKKHDVYIGGSSHVGDDCFIVATNDGFHEQIISVWGKLIDSDDIEL